MIDLKQFGAVARTSIELVDDIFAYHVDQMRGMFPDDHSEEDYRCGLAMAVELTKATIQCMAMPDEGEFSGG